MALICVVLELDLELRVVLQNVARVNHVLCPPHIEKGLPVGQDIWVPIDVDVLELLTKSMHLYPENAVVFLGNVLITKNFFEFWSPRLLVVNRELPFVALMSPWVFDKQHLETLVFHHLEDGVSMT